MNEPSHLTPREAEEMRRRRRVRNIALLVVLTALSLLFYAITIVKMTKHG